MTAMYCANHLDTETHLRCSRCMKPICPRCVIQTPVGGRCRECANVRKAPIFQVGARRYARAAAYGLGAAVLGGFLWAELGGGFRLLLLVVLGYAIGEAVSRGAGRKIGTPLSALAGALTLFSIAIGPAVSVLVIEGNQLPLGARLVVALDAGVGVLLGTLFSGLFALLFLALAVVVAVSRVR